ncbi:MULTISPECIES: hypothetical protein [Metallosphaera]|uniref:hypothetical protein n=1 Tax=Metallosphaera TaxID=41980 RepID=UPI001F064B47|nr:hypothetical protein [Metallosphaera sedula]MCH1771930.1 hypothetical protein [Metallosphaera sedula]MCP6728548.1 hypothetical protein [Metallosphaera sedula]
MSGITPFDVSQQKGIKFESISLEYLKLYERIYSELKKRDGKALLYGSIGIFHRVGDIKEAVELLKLYRKSGPQDVNVLVPIKYRDVFKEILREQGWTPYYHLERLMGDIAGMFFYESFVLKAYYMDKVKFNHEFVVDWNEEFSMNLTDLLLTKLQMHFPTDKDSADIGAILMKANLIDIKRVIEQVSAYEGFWKDATDNLSKVKSLIGRLEMDNVKTRDQLRQVIVTVTKLHGELMKVAPNRQFKEDEKYWLDF